MAARRRDMCQHCAGTGSQRQVRAVPVEPLRSSVPGVGELFLCASCDGKEDRTVWLRYRRGG
jgi:DnaJ-class molecular chaperone